MVDKHWQEDKALEGWDTDHTVGCSIYNADISDLLLCRTYTIHEYVLRPMDPMSDNRWVSFKFQHEFHYFTRPGARSVCLLSLLARVFQALLTVQIEIRCSWVLNRCLLYVFSVKRGSMLKTRLFTVNDIQEREFQVGLDYNYHFRCHCFIVQL